MTGMVGIDDVMAKLKTKIQALDENLEIKQCTYPLVTPSAQKAVFLVPATSPKGKAQENVFRHIHKIDIVIIKNWAKTIEESLIHSTEGLIPLMKSIETLLENDVLLGDDGENLLSDVECYPEAYELPGVLFVDNLYARGGILKYSGETNAYEHNRT
jgi:hypothetical protein